MYIGMNQNTQANCGAPIGSVTRARILVTYGLPVRVQPWALVEIGHPSAQQENGYLSYGHGWHHGASNCSRDMLPREWRWCMNVQVQLERKVV